ncbi:MAG: hypothetical protein RLZZ220_612 [Pseudomonadota bacterium]|jgi:hypothetical protein
MGSDSIDFPSYGRYSVLFDDLVSDTWHVFRVLSCPAIRSM